MSWLLDALWHAVFLWVPLWVWALLAIAACVVVFRVFGWRQTLAAAAAAGAFLLYAFGARQGRDAQIQKDIKDAQKAIDKARAARAAADRRNADPDRVFDNDGHRRD